MPTFDILVQKASAEIQGGSEVEGKIEEPGLGQNRYMELGRSYSQVTDDHILK